MLFWVKKNNRLKNKFRNPISTTNTSSKIDSYGYIHLKNEEKKPHLYVVNKTEHYLNQQEIVPD